MAAGAEWVGRGVRNNSLLVADAPPNPSYMSVHSRSKRYAEAQSSVPDKSTPLTATDPWDELPRFREALTVAGVKSVPVPQVLYHYTSADGFLGILSEGKLFASDSKFFNDSSEGEYGMSRLAPQLARFEELVDARITSIIRGLVKDRQSEPLYVVCFCDDDDVLGQWRGYSANGAGYALGIPGAALSGNGLAPLLPVRYGDAAVDDAVRAVIDWSLPEVARISAQRSKEWEVAVGNVLTAAIATLFLIVVTSKRKVFRHEQEWRLVYPQYATPSLTIDSLKFRAAEGLIVPYHEFVLPRREDGRLALSCVRCGPMRHEDRRVDGVKTRLQAIGLGDVPVLVSEAPLRR